jgi:homoserine kinase
MGSSAAALTAGVVIADELLDLGWKPADSRRSGAPRSHPDNVAPCTLGSIVASAIDSGGVTRAVRLDLPKSFDLAIVVPDFDLPTSKARAVLPSGYSREDAVFNVQRAALLIAALATGTTSVFPAAIEDRFHQPYREALVPGLHEILRLRAPGLLGCALSGAGPSIWFFFERATKASAGWWFRSSACRARSGDAALQYSERGFELTREEKLFQRGERREHSPR